MLPAYNIDKIKFSIGAQAFNRAVNIYESGGLSDFKDEDFGFSAIVRGSTGNFYHVYVSAKTPNQGECDCYLGQNDELCKHLAAVAIQAVKQGGKLNSEEKKFIERPQCSGRCGELEKGQLLEIKAEISAAMRYIKPYNGPSRVWFAYQNSLDEGCARLAAIVSALPVSTQTAKLMVALLLRLDEKLSNAVDDSNGTVGGFMEEIVLMLEEYFKLDPSCVMAFKELKNQETVFGWEEPLLELLDNSIKN